MLFGLFSVYDIQAQSFSAPFTSPTVETATRDFARAVRDSKNHPDKFPQDYQLFHIGGFTANDGRVVALNQPALICKGVDYLEE